jgi:nanoRNase/pAp phosphatase (c-di-AMP/oligoRNAs hydrolase)
MNRILRIGARRVELDDLDAFSIVCLVDTQPQFGNNALASVCRASIVIDHHLTPKGASVDAEFCDLRPDYGATSTIMYEYALAAKLKLTTSLATALFYGIQSDTQDLGRETSPADADAYLALFTHTNKTQLAYIHRAPVPVDYFRALQDSLVGCVIAGKAVISSIREGHNPDMMAEVADRMLRLDGVRASVCYGVCGDTIHLSARTADGRCNAARKMRLVVRRLGSGGGHNTVAGGQVPVDGDPEKRMAVLQARILKAFAGNQPPRPLIPHRSKP